MTSTTLALPDHLDLSAIKKIKIQTQMIRIIIKGFADRKFEIKLPSDAAVWELVSTVNKQIAAVSCSNSETAQTNYAHMVRPSPSRSVESICEFYDKSSPHTTTAPSRNPQNGCVSAAKTRFLSMLICVPPPIATPSRRSINNSRFLSPARFSHTPLQNVNWRRATREMRRGFTNAFLLFSQRNSHFVQASVKVIFRFY
eukprot:516284_1